MKYLIEIIKKKDDCLFQVDLKTEKGVIVSTENSSAAIYGILDCFEIIELIKRRKINSIISSVKLEIELKKGNE